MFTFWDIALIVVVSVMGTAIAYVRDPEHKAFVLMLPIPFTLATAAIPLDRGHGRADDGDRPVGPGRSWHPWRIGFRLAAAAACALAAAPPVRQAGTCDCRLPFSVSDGSDGSVRSD